MSPSGIDDVSFHKEWKGNSELGLRTQYNFPQSFTLPKEDVATSLGTQHHNALKHQRLMGFLNSSPDVWGTVSPSLQLLFSPVDTDWASSLAFHWSRRVNQRLEVMAKETENTLPPAITLPAPVPLFHGQSIVDLKETFWAKESLLISALPSFPFIDQMFRNQDSCLRCRMHWMRNKKIYPNFWKGDFW